MCGTGRPRQPIIAHPGCGLKPALRMPSSRGGAAGGEDEGLVDVSGVKVLARRVPSLPANELRNLADTFRGKLRSGVVLLGTEAEGKVTLLAAVTSDLVARVSADDLARAMAPVVGGRGGGKGPDQGEDVSPKQAPDPVPEKRTGWERKDQ